MKLHIVVPHWGDKVKAVLGIILVISFLGRGFVTTAQAQSDAGLVAEWHFDEGSGTILRDSSGNGNDGMIRGATWTTGISGKALSFDGKDDCVEAPLTESLTDDLSVEFWMRNSVILSDQTRIVDLGRSSSTGFQLCEWKDGSIIVDNTGGPAANVKTQEPYNDGYWHHVVGVRKGNEYRLYVDGIYVNSITGTIPLYDYVFIGKRAPIGDLCFFDGFIDEIRIYNRALSSGEIKAHYDAFTAPSVPSTVTSTSTPTPVPSVSDANLVAEWHFDEGSGTILRDSSGNGNDGTIHGATWTTGISGKALSFDGKDDYIDCGNDASLDITDEITIEAWVKRSATGIMHIVDRRPTAIKELNYDLGFYRDNKLRFYYRNSGDTAWHKWDSTDAYTDTTNWQHFALIFTFGDGSSIKAYRNGQIISGYWIEGNGNDAVINVDSPVHIGRATNGVNPFSGIIDEVRIYNRALTADEIKAHYETPGASAPSSTVTSTPSSAISSTPAAETPYSTPTPEEQAKDSNLMLYGLIGAIGIVGVVIAVKVGGNVASKAREKKDEKIQEQREREEYERKIQEWEDQGYDVSEMKEELKK